MSLGKEPGTVVFPDGTLFGPSSIEIDMDAYDIPIWRMIRKEGSSKPQKGKSLSGRPMKIFFFVWRTFQLQPPNGRKPFLKPPGSGTERAIRIATDDQSVIAEFIEVLPTGSEILTSDKRLLGTKPRLLQTSFLTVCLFFL